MTIQQTTPHLGLPLPHPDNSLEDDVPRIRAALAVLDHKVEALDMLLHSDDLTLDTVQELVAAIKAARSDIGAVNTLVAEQLAIQEANLSNRLTIQSAAIDSQLAGQQSAVNTQLASQNDRVAAQLTAISTLLYAGL